MNSTSKVAGTANEIFEAFGDLFYDMFAPDSGRVGRAVASCETSPIKSGGRRSKAEIQAIRAEIMAVVIRQRPMTVRQVFYQLVTRGVIPKSEAEYKSTVCRLLSQMRRDGELPFDWIADSTRWMRKPSTYSSVEEMLQLTQETYRRAIWDSQDAYVEVWLEKEALAGVLVAVTCEWDVPLMVCRGYPSLSFLHSAAEQIKAQEKPTHLYYFGDRDPSGVDIDRFVETSIREIAGEGIDMVFQRVAVLPEQIEEYNLQTRPTKKTDSRSKSFEGESVEVDAIDPDTLRQLCSDCITQHINQHAYDRMLVVEECERETLATVIENLGDAA